jgi:hypothetical protein
MATTLPDVQHQEVSVDIDLHDKTYVGYGIVMLC